MTDSSTKRPRSPSPTERYSTNMPDRFTLDDDSFDWDETGDGQGTSSSQDAFWGTANPGSQAAAAGQRAQSSQDRFWGTDRRGSVAIVGRRPDASPEMFGGGSNSSSSGRAKTDVSHDTGLRSFESRMDDAFNNEIPARTAQTPLSRKRSQIELETPPHTADKRASVPPTHPFGADSPTPSQSQSQSHSQQSLFLSPTHSDVSHGISADSIHAYVKMLEADVARKTRQVTALTKSKEYLQSQLKKVKEEADRKARFCDGCRKGM
ncbi:hypothetical protein DFJ77DRAFT_347195 [Powellomyces hirtus]|nr:hypothetical protein DFJ77DRAFT_347195 [Powellomyces hirtus]